MLLPLSKGPDMLLMILHGLIFFDFVLSLTPKGD